MENVQHDRIGKHKSALKNPEKPLILKNGANVIYIGDVERSCGEIFNGPKYRARDDQKTAD